jgi:hypothetical protein
VLLLCQAYFHHQATVIQKCWRGYFSRSRVHDFYKRKAYLAAVAAANAAVRAGMAAELQEALQHQQQQAQQAAKQHFDAQVGCRNVVYSGASGAVGEAADSELQRGLLYASLLLLLQHSLQHLTATLHNISCSAGVQQPCKLRGNVQGP